MKKIIALLSIALFVTSFKDCPKNTVFVDKKFYSVCYSEVYRNPIRVEYKTYKPVHNVDRTGLNFYKEPNVKTATDQDFIGNQWDKGHCFPAESASDSKEKLESTFSYVNCSVQNYQLNRGSWKILETQERNWAQDDSLLVTVDVIIDKKSGKLPSGTYIPSYFQKTIVWLSTKKKRKFKFPNEQCDKNIYLYEVIAK